MLPSMRPILERIDRLGVRPLPLIGVVVCSLVAWFGSVHGEVLLVAPAITAATPTPQLVSAAALLAQVHVRVGQRVRRGDLLATLSAPEIEADRREVEGKIEQVVRSERLRQLELAQSQRELRMDAQARRMSAEHDRKEALARRARQQAEALLAEHVARDAADRLAQGLVAASDVASQNLAAQKQSLQRDEAESLLRAELERLVRLEQDEANAPDDLTALQAATSRLHEAELSILVSRRERISAQLQQLALRANTDGVVDQVLPAGSRVELGEPIMWIVPPFASEVVAYLDSAVSPQPHLRSAGYTVALSNGQQCEGQGTFRSSGRVEPKPSQLAGFLGNPGVGFALRVDLPIQCHLPIGQRVELRTSKL